MADTRQQENIQRSRLNAARYSKQKTQQQFRGSLLQDNSNKDQNDDVPEESRYKNNLGLLKAGAIKKANAEAGGAVGATVGGAVGSVIPVIGTGFGAAAGRFLGRKMGVTRIITYTLITFAALMLLFTILFIAIMDGVCNTYAGAATDYFTLNICSSLK